MADRSQLLRLVAPGAFEPIVRQHARDDPRFVYLSNGLPRIKDHWKLYLLEQGRKDLLKRAVVFGQEDLRRLGRCARREVAASAYGWDTAGVGRGFTVAPTNRGGVGTAPWRKPIA